VTDFDYFPRLCNIECKPPCHLVKYLGVGNAWHSRCLLTPKSFAPTFGFLFSAVQMPCFCVGECMNVSSFATVYTAFQHSGTSKVKSSNGEGYQASTSPNCSSFALFSLQYWILKVRFYLHEKNSCLFNITKVRFFAD